MSYRLDVLFETPAYAPWAEAIYLDVCVGPSHRTRLVLNPRQNTLTLQRQQAGDGPTQRGFGAASIAALWNQERTATLAPRQRYHLEAIVDGCTIEVIANDGEAYLSSLIFPPPEAFGLSVSVAGNGGAFLNYFEVNY